MLQEILKYFLVYISSSVKFVFGPLLGTSYGFHVLITGSLTILGMMTSVYVFTYFGDWIRIKSQKLFSSKDKKKFSKSSRRNVTVWLKYGVPGIAFLTPILLTPIGGTVLANAFGGKKEDILKYMWISCILWSYPISWALKYASYLLPFINTNTP